VTETTPTRGGAAPGAEVVLRLEGVRKSFGGTTVLDGVDLDVARDEVVALIGASGSGKSTLLRTVNLLEQVDDGRIVLDGQDVTDPRVRVDAVRARIGVVFQHYNLFPHLTVLDNVSLASRHVLRRPRAEAEARALELLERVGLGDKARAYPDRLSGGQQQHRRARGEVLDLVRTLKDVGTTILMATHEMAFARDVADRVVFLDAGRVAEQGPPAQLFSAPRTERAREFLSRVSG
jgi:ABC-type polar amino acid transport system ATPase subunit